MRGWIWALLLLAFAAGEAQGQSVVTDKAVYGFEDTIVITYANPGEDSLVLALQRPHQVLADYTQWPYDLRIEGGDAGSWSIPASAFLYPNSQVGNEHDPSRVWLRVAFLQSRAGKYIPINPKWILLQRRSPPASGILSLPGRDRFVVGEHIEVGLQGIDALRADNRVDPAHDGAVLYAELWKAGRVVPGGASLPDRKGYVTFDIPEGATSLIIAPTDEPLVDELGYSGVGHYELRLHGAAGAVLDRIRFSVDLPPASAFTLSLDPPSEGPYDYSAGPYAHLSVLPEYLASFSDFIRPDLSLCQPEPGGTTSCVKATGSMYLVDNVLRGEAAGDAVYVSGGIRPGSFAFILTGAYEVAGAYVHEHLAKLASIAFEAGGNYPPHWLPTRPEPRLNFGDVALALDSGALVSIGQQVNASLAVPAAAGLAERDLFAKVYPAEDFGFNCWPLLVGLEHYPQSDSVYQIGELRPDAAGWLSFVAPEMPGRYELRIMEKNSLGEAVPLARAFFTAEVRVPPDVLRLESNAVIGWGETIKLSWQLPPDLPFERAWPHLYRAAEILPGGAWRAAHHYGLSGNLAAVVEHDVAARSGTAEFGPFAIPGPYEVRLWSGFDGRWQLARLSFDVLPPEGAPQPPAGTEFARAPQFDDWPSYDDPRRGPAVWTPAAADCVDPSFPEPPTLRLVEKLTGDPEDESDDRYSEVTTPFPGHPYHLEAIFTTAPPEADYRATLNDALRVVVSRTADPRVYRSEQIVPWEKTAP